MEVQHIKKHGELLLVRVPDTKTGISRASTTNHDFVPYVKKYTALRPSHATAKNFAITKLSIASIANFGGNSLELQRLGWWQSENVARSYIDDSNLNRQNSATKIYEWWSWLTPKIPVESKLMKMFRPTNHLKKKLTTEKNSVTVNVPLHKNLNINNCGNVTIKYNLK